jgi:uncharacterized protein YbaP (TraB family)
MGLQPAMFQMVDAWYASLLVTIAEARAAGFDSELGLDAHLGKQATADGKRTQRAGRRHEAAGDVRSHGQAGAIAADGRIARRNEGGKAALQRLHAQWRSGDVDQLWKKLGVEFRDEYPGALQDDQQRSQRGMGADAPQAPRLRRAPTTRWSWSARCTCSARTAWSNA